ncbi:hypothetical protein AAG906_010553 [Vitis piasezkii]
MEEEAKPIFQPQRRLNPHMQEVVRAEVSKLLKANYLPHIDSPWVKIDVEDQEKTTFTCPFGTYAYRRMPFGLCNAPATFQRCMLSIFSDMVERIMEVFMDDITIYGRAVLGQREDGKPYVIYYASKTLNEQDAKARLIRWILLLQEFNLQIRDKKGVENVVVDHLSSEWKAQDRKHFFAKIHAYYWEELFLFKYCVDQIRRKCVPEEEQQGILSHCHESACGGHFASQKTAMKVLQSGFSWPSLFKDAHTMCRSCNRCQRLGKLTLRNQMPMNPILIVDLFYVWGIDFMGPFPMSFGNSYILVGVDYVSKWVEAIISDGGTHFCNKPFETLLAKYGVKHKVATPYHPQTSGQVELANRKIKNMLMKVVNTSRRDWSIKLHDSLWAYRTAYKTILGMSPYCIVYGKVCHLPVEVEYKAWWAIKKVNMDMTRVGVKRCLDLNEMEELRNDAYINSKVAKQRMKRWHGQLISNKDFRKGQRLLLYDSRLHIFPGKLKSRWIGPFIIHQVHLNGVVELLNSNSTYTFKVNGHRLKPFMEPFNQDKEEVNLLEPQRS